MASIADLAWLTGTWSGHIGDDVVEETWMEPGGGCLAGVFRWLQADAVHLYEILAIEEEDGDLVLRMRHFEPGLVPWACEAKGPKSWRLVTREARRAVFENPSVTFPRRVIYERLDDRTLLARIEGEKASGPAELEFRFSLR